MRAAMTVDRGGGSQWRRFYAPGRSVCGRRVRGFSFSTSLIIRFAYSLYSLRHSSHRRTHKHEHALGFEPAPSPSPSIASHRQPFSQMKESVRFGVGSRKCGWIAFVYSPSQPLIIRHQLNVPFYASIFNPSCVSNQSASQAATPSGTTANGCTPSSRAERCCVYIKPKDSRIMWDEMDRKTEMKYICFEWFVFTLNNYLTLLLGFAVSSGTNSQSQVRRPYR